MHLPVAARRCSLLLIGAALASLSQSAGSANAPMPRDYPNRPVRMVNPYAPGGTVDIVARALAMRATESLGQQVIVDNRPGANTNIGTEIVARAAPDGYTLLTNSSTISTNPAVYKKMAFDPVKDLDCVGLSVHTPNVLAVHPTLPANSVKELVELARNAPGKIPFASSGLGGTTFFALALFRHMAKVDLLHIPYKGGGPAIADLLGGQVKGVFNPPGGVLQHIRAGRLRGLAVTSAKRAIVAPDLPTVAELGYPGYEVIVWYATFAPRGTPRGIVERWNAEINRALGEKETRERFLAVAMEPMGGTPAECARFFQGEVARWKQLVKETGLNVE